MYKILALLSLLIFSPLSAFAVSPAEEIVYRSNLGRADDVELMIKQGASADQKDKNGVPVIALAAGRIDTEGLNVVKTLIAHGANVNAADTRGQSALFYAAKQGSKDTVSYLLEHGADYYATDKNGDIARTAAYQAGHPDTLALMDSFIQAKTAQVNKAYAEANKALKERYKREAEQAAEAAKQQQQENQQQALTEKQKQEAELLAQEKQQQTAAAQKQKETQQSIIEKRNSPQFKKDMSDLAYKSCVLQYWSFCSNVGKSTELSEEDLAAAISKYRELVEITSARLTKEYVLPVEYVNTISKNAMTNVFIPLNSMPSNRYRHDRGVGEIKDMEKRCNNIAANWDMPAAKPPAARAKQQPQRKSTSRHGHQPKPESGPIITQR